MKLKKLTFMAATAMCAALSMTSCSSDDDIQTNVPSQNEVTTNLISFNPSVEGMAQTRAIIDGSNLTDQTLRVFGLRVYSSSYSTIFDQVDLNYENGAWKHNQPTSWVDGADYTFWAVTPKEVECSSTVESGGYRTMRLSNIPAVQLYENGLDVLVSNASRVKKNAGEVAPVDLQMKHILGTLVVNVVNSGDFSVKVKRAELKLPNSEATSYFYGNYASSGTSYWNSTAYDNVTTPTAELFQTYTFANQTLTKENQSMSTPKYLVSPNGTKNMPMFFDLEYDILDETGKVINSKQVLNRKINVKITKGTQNVMNIKFNPDTYAIMMEFGSVAVSDFDEAAVPQDYTIV